MLRPLLLRTASLLALAPLTLPAQDADAFEPLELPAEADAGGVETLEELVVETSKLDETFAQTSASIGRVDAGRIRDAELRNVNDAYRLLGNVRAPQFVDGGFVIRGVNSEAPDAENISGSQTPLSTIFVDGVALTQQGARRGPNGVWDVRSIEVLRGPQSTLQGRNSLAGSVNILTNDPGPDFGGAVRYTYGEYNNREQAAMLNLPVTEEFALRFTAEHAEMDSFVRYPNLKRHPRYDDFSTSRSLQLRGKALYQSSSLPLTSLLTYTYSENSPALSDVYGPAADPAVGSFHDRVWLSASGVQQIRETQNHAAAWETKYEFSNTLRLTALSTYARTQLNVGQIDGGNVRDDLEQDYTQELRLNWNDTWGRAVLGFYGARSEGESTQAAIEKRRVNAALFGEIDWLAADRLHLIAGGRIDHDDFRFNANVPGSGARSASTRNTEFLPKAGIRYEFTDTHTLGLTLQSGYQSGGVGIDLDGVPFEFDPSSTWHYELAWRKAFLDERLTVSANAFHSDWKDQQVVLRTVDSATFNMSERVINAAESTMYGGEIEISWAATERLRFFASIGLLSTRFDDFTYAIDPAIAAILGIPDTLDYRGYEFPEAPNLNFSLGFDWHHESGFFLAADAAYSGSYYSPVLFAPLGVGGGVSTQVPQDDVIKVDSNVTVNLTLGYQRDNWKLSVFARNLFNEKYVVGTVPTATGTPTGIAYHGDFLATVGPPRFFGCSLELTF